MRLLCYEGGNVHTWEPKGLDVNADGVLVNVRECLRCDRSEEKPYGAGGGRSWRRYKMSTPVGIDPIKGATAPLSTGVGHV